MQVYIFIYLIICYNYRKILLQIAKNLNTRIHRSLIYTLFALNKQDYISLQYLIFDYSDIRIKGDNIFVTTNLPQIILIGEGFRPNNLLIVALLGDNSLSHNMTGLQCIFMVFAML